MKLTHTINSVVVTVLVCSVTPTFAATKLEKSYEKIEGVVEDIQKELKVSDTRGKGTTHIKNAISQIRDLRSAITKYEREGKGVASVKDLAEDMERALNPLEKSLKSLSQARRWWDPVDKLKDYCDEKIIELQKEIDEVNKNTEDYDARDIEKLSDEYEDAIDDLVTEGDKRLNSVKYHIKQANRFRNQTDVLKPIKTELTSAGRRYTKYLQQEFKQNQRACYRMIADVRKDELGDLEGLLEETGKNIEDFIDDSDEWLTASYKLFALSCKAKQDLRKEICSRDEVDDDPSQEGYVNKILGQQKNLITGKLSEVISEYKDLKKVGDALLDVGDYDDVEDKYDEMRLRATKLIKLAKDAVYKGFRDPKIQLLTSYGTDVHDQLQASKGCDLSETKIANSNKRWDCFIANECAVVEFKPKGSREDAAGQAAGYARSMSSFWTKKLQIAIKQIKSGELEIKGNYDDREAPPVDAVVSLYRGDPLAEVYEEMVTVSGCVGSDGKVSLDSEPYHYEPCNKKYPLRCDNPMKKY